VAGKVIIDEIGIGVSENLRSVRMEPPPTVRNGNFKQMIVFGIGGNLLRASGIAANPEYGANGIFVAVLKPKVQRIREWSLMNLLRWSRKAF
jgi:hypothetical protein